MLLVLLLTPCTPWLTLTGWEEAAAGQRVAELYNVSRAESCWFYISDFDAGYTGQRKGRRKKEKKKKDEGEEKDEDKKEEKENRKEEEQRREIRRKKRSEEEEEEEKRKKIPAIVTATTSGSSSQPSDQTGCSNSIDPFGQREG